MINDRRGFLKFAGLAGAATLMPRGKAEAAPPAPAAAGGPVSVPAGACTLIPAETAGPFPLDLTANTFYLRKDIREDRPGTPFNVKLRILGAGNCGPMANVRVNIWHCDKEGAYSGYDNSMNPGQAGKTYLRGYQVTDANGECSFLTVFPGWYPGRTGHIHFQVYVSSAYAAVSQLTWDHAAKNAVYAAAPTVYTKGADPLAPGNDGIFRDGYTPQVATLTANNSGGYDSFLEVTVQGTGSTGLGHLERENAKRFSLGQNLPNPHAGATVVPLGLVRASRVTLELWDVSGKRVAALPQGRLAAGDHRLRIDLAALGLPVRDYLYQVEVDDGEGTFREFKLMTAAKSR